MAFAAVRVLCAASLALVAACDVGSALPGPGGDDDPGADAAVSIDAPVPAYSLALDPPALTTALGTEVTYVVTVQASAFDGPVALAVSGAPASWTITFTPPTVTALDGSTVASEMKVVIPSNGEAAPAGTPLTVDASAAPGPRSATATLTVANEYTFSIGDGTGAGLHFGAMAGGLLRLRAGATLHITNNDTVGHRIHAGGGVFEHQATTMGPGQSYTVTVLDGSDTFYCHNHGQDKGEVNVNAQ
jgi:plastocyanin